MSEKSYEPLMCFEGVIPNLGHKIKSVKEEMEEEKRVFCEKMREEGYKAAFSNDGWIYREEKKINISCATAYFDDGISEELEKGKECRAVLGCPWMSCTPCPIVIFKEDKERGYWFYRPDQKTESVRDKIDGLNNN